MPGAYAHLTLINQFREPRRLEKVAGFPAAGVVAALKYFKFCELGAVSPDYPYMAVGNGGAAKWADEMHYTRTGEVVHAGIRIVRSMDGEKQRKCLAWLLGYASHVAADVTVHPIVRLKVGDYAPHKTEHRVCEMNQDAYVFPRLGVGPIGVAEHLRTGPGACGDAKDLDRDVSALWKAMLGEVYPGEYRGNEPDPSLWHRSFRLMVDELAEGATHLVPFARHVAVDCGLTYPAPGEVDTQYIRGLALPDGRRESYDFVFDRAVENATEMLAIVARGCLVGDDGYRTAIGNWDLDTGRDAAQHLAYWEEAA